MWVTVLNDPASCTCHKLSFLTTVDNETTSFLKRFTNLSNKRQAKNSLFNILNVKSPR